VEEDEEEEETNDLNPTWLVLTRDDDNHYNTFMCHFLSER